MKNKIPNELALRQQQLREETQIKVRESIEILKSLGYRDISISMLVKETGLSRSTFNKSHVEEILKEYKIGKYKDIKNIIIDQQEFSNKIKIKDLEAKLNNALIKIGKLENTIKEQQNKLDKKNIELVKNRQELQSIVGNFQSLYDIIVAKGIDIKL